MEYESAVCTAERLGVTIRTIQKWCKEGKIKDAKKLGRDWQIPVDTKRPNDATYTTDDGRLMLVDIPFRLTNADFELGKCYDYIESIENLESRNITLGEYYYYIGEFEKASIILEPYLNSNNPTYKGSASLICAFANLSLKHEHMTDFTCNLLADQLENELALNTTPLLRAIDVMVSTVLGVMFHYSNDKIPPLHQYVKYLPDGLKAYSCYLMSYRAYLRKDYSRSLGIADTCLACSSNTHPIPDAYLHIMASINLMNLMKPKEAKIRFGMAWDLLKHDNIITPIVEHHGLLLGLVEVYFKKDYPEIFKKIINATKNFNNGWFEVHNRSTGGNVASNLTPTEFTVAMLYNRGWRIKEIANHIELSERTVKNYLQLVYEKLNINGKKQLEKFMLK